MKILLDTSVILNLVRIKDYYARLAAHLPIFQEEPELYVSVVSKAELLSLCRSRGVAERNEQELMYFFNTFRIIDVTASAEQLHKCYRDLETFSRNKHAVKPPNGAFTLGQNDLWIAATALAIASELVTIDNDFLPFGEHFLPVHIAPAR